VKWQRKIGDFSLPFHEQRVKRDLSKIQVIDGALLRHYLQNLFLAAS